MKLKTAAMVSLNAGVIERFWVRFLLISVLYHAGETHLNFLHHKKENRAKFVTLFWDS